MNIRISTLLPLIIAVFACCSFNAFGQANVQTDSVHSANDSLKLFLNKQVKSVDVTALAAQGIEFSFGVFPMGDSIIVAQHKGKKNNAWDTEASEYVQINNKEPKTDLFVSSADGLNSRPLNVIGQASRNDGAACISPDGRELYFTQSYKVQKTLHFSIQYAVKEKNQWVVKQGREWEHKTISYAYPSISPDGKQLYFASNKNGSWDIYVLKRVGSQWGEPQALAYVNSTDDELFPTVLNDSILLLSASRSDSYGGLDIYYVNTKTKSKPTNMKLPINSEYDDVAIAFRAGSDSSGYLVSNRNPSIPKDQLYSFTIHWKPLDTSKTPLLSCEDDLVPINVSFMLDQSLKAEAESKLADFSKYVKETYKVPTSVNFTPGAKLSPDVDPSQNMVDVSLSVPRKGEADVRQRLAALMESLLREENKLAQQRKETEKTSKLYEQVAKNATAAAAENLPAKTVAAVPSTPKDDGLEDVNLFFKSYQSNDDIQAIIEVIDPGTELLGRPKRVESRQKVNLKKGNDYAVNVSVEKDDDMYIAGNKAPGKSSTIEVTKDQKKTIYTENKEYEDVYNKLYTVQVTALAVTVPASYFGKLRNLKMYACLDGLNRYTYGRAASAQDAERILQTVREAGFSDAFIISLRRIEKKLQDVYAIQVEASFTRREASYFKNLSNVMEYVGCTDDMYRYAVGRYTSINEAMTELNRIKALGYSTAFITNVKRFDFKRGVE